MKLIHANADVPPARFQPGLPGYLVTGVELGDPSAEPPISPEQDALTLARHLGAYSLRRFEPRIVPGRMLDVFAPDTEDAAEALTLQAQLLKAVAEGNLTGETFVFETQDINASRVLRNAVKQVDDLALESTAVRDMRRYRPSIVDTARRLGRLFPEATISIEEETDLNTSNPETQTFERLCEEKYTDQKTRARVARPISSRLIDQRSRDSSVIIKTKYPNDNVLGPYK